MTVPPAPSTPEERAMAARAVCICHTPNGKLAFVITDDPDAVTWGEQVARIADIAPKNCRWEVLPVPEDVSERHFFRSVLT